MSLDRFRIATIKEHFARKSSVRLQAIMQANDPERWSAEAVAAAGELLQDRKAGRAEEPQVSEDEDEPPPYHYEPGEVALGLLGGLLTGHMIIPYHRVLPERDLDLPVPFGPKIAWLALDTTSTEAVAAALGLRDVTAAPWSSGVQAAYQSAVFVTPPLADWTLAVSTSLFPPDRADTFVKPLLERLGRQFGEIQYFATHSDIELHIWACARKGRLVRGYGWLGQQGLTLWDEGKPTREERDLGVQTGASPRAPDEAFVMQLACLWSIDPTGLNEQFKEPERGLLGRLP